jgi:hypothetical protein
MTYNKDMKKALVAINNIPEMCGLGLKEDFLDSAMAEGHY